MSKTIMDKVIGILKTNLTKDEWIELGDVLDSGEDDMLDKVNEHLMKIAPEVFADADELALQESIDGIAALVDTADYSDREVERE